jgi:hypothetical protein
VRRVWMSAAPAEHAGVAWCGVEVHQAHPRAEQKWRAFDSTVSGR